MSVKEELRITAVPSFSAGHVIPMVDMARLFARHGAAVTIIATESNARIFQADIDRDSAAGHQIQTHIVTFPAADVGLPAGIENFSDVSSLDLLAKVYQGFQILNVLLDNHIIPATRPDCILSDFSDPWTTDTAARLAVPRLVFFTSNFMAYLAEHSVLQSSPHKNVGSETEQFELPGLPHKIQMFKSQLPEFLVRRDGYTDLIHSYKEAERRSFGTVANTFYELDGVYLEHYTNTIGIKAWGVGPLSLAVNKDQTGKINRGSKSRVESEELLEWLDSKEPNSVMYVSFGSMARFPTAQITEIAHGLEDSGHNFIWVVRKKDSEEAAGDGLPEGFEDRIKSTEKGLIVRIWAPQLLILEHESTGGFLTHCGWNSTIEGVSAGQPMVTWPVSSEQFFNEKLVTEVLEVGVPVGARRWWNKMDEIKEIVGREKVEKAVKYVLGATTEAATIRRRVKELAAAAKRAVESSGSSGKNIVSLIKELRSIKVICNGP